MRLTLRVVFVLCSRRLKQMFDNTFFVVSQLVRGIYVYVCFVFFMLAVGTCPKNKSTSKVSPTNEQNHKKGKDTLSKKQEKHSYNKIHKIIGSRPSDPNSF